MRAATVTLETGSGYYIFRPSAVSLIQQRHVCPEHEIPDFEDANGNLLQTLSFVIQRRRFGGSVYKNIFLIVDCFSMEVPIGTRIMKCQVNSTRCIDQEVKFSNCKIPLPESAQNESTEKVLQSMEDNYCRPTTDTLTKKIDYCLDIMSHEAVLCKHVTIPPYKQIRFKTVTKIYDLFHPQPKNSPKVGCCISSAVGIREVDVNIPFGFFLTNFSDGEKTLLKKWVLDFLQRVLLFI